MEKAEVKITPKNIVDEARDMPWKVAIEPSAWPRASTMWETCG